MEKYTTKNGCVIVELEDVVIDTQNIVLEDNESASKGKHIRFLKENFEKPSADADAMAGFELTFDKSGRQYIWVRYMAKNPCSVWVDYGGEEYRTRERGYVKKSFIKTMDNEPYVWKRIANFQASEGQSINVRICSCDKDLVIDKMIFTDNIKYIPEGIGEIPRENISFKPQKMPEDRYPIPSVIPPHEHPRVLFRAKDIAKIKENMLHPEMEIIVKTFEELKNTTYTGELESIDPNYDAKGLEIIAAKALDYAFYGNEDNGRQAIFAIKNYAIGLDVTTAGDNCRQMGHVIKILGQVYDWCYPLLNNADKAELMALAQSISMDMEVGFPPDEQSIMCGHGAENQLYRDWLIMAIACYDEYPDAYNLVAGKIFSPDSVDYRNWWNKSGTHSQGSSYPLQMRYKAEMYAHILIKRMCGEELFNEEDLVKIAYDWIQRRRPDGLFMIDGNDTTANTIKRNTPSKKAKDVMFLAYVISGDPILKKEFFFEGGLIPKYYRDAVQPIDMLLLNNPDIEIKNSLDTLPLAVYHPSPLGEMIVRTGWDIMNAASDDIVATMTISEYNGMNHTHYDCGHFMIYYKGILASDSGWYEKYSSQHNRNYNTQSVAHNTLVIETEYNKWGNQNQGIDGNGVDIEIGANQTFYDYTWEQYQQNEQNRWAYVIGHEIEPSGYSYLAGDITNAYTSDYDDEVEEVLRHMIFIPTANKKNPAVFVVFDKIQTKAGGKKKAFLLHMEEEPEVKNNITIIKRTERDYNGKLVNQTLLPSMDDLKIEKLGGIDKRFWNKGKNWPLLQEMGLAEGADDAKRKINPDNSLEVGWGRVEISPKESSKLDYMLNVMYIGSADDVSEIEKAMLIETDDFAGAKIFDRVVMFNKNKARTKDTLKFTVSGDEQDLKINVAGLESGVWSISVNGTDVITKTASEDGGILYFTAPSGNYTLTYTK